jgi:hypothetical protein
VEVKLLHKSFMTIGNIKCRVGTMGPWFEFTREAIEIPGHSSLSVLFSYHKTMALAIDAYSFTLRRVLRLKQTGHTLQLSMLFVQATLIRRGKT